MLIFDSNGIAHAAKHVTKELSFAKDYSAIIFAFIKKIMAIKKDFVKTKADDSANIFVWDSKTSLRKKIYPDYKANRNENLTDEELLLNKIAGKQFAFLKDEVLPQLGFNNIFCVDGLEGDDIIGSIVNTTPKIFDIVMVTRDHDHYQLLSKNCHLYDNVTSSLYRVKDFKKEFGISPKEWVAVKCIAGCFTDHVKGVKGVKEKTAIKFLKGELPAKYKTFKEIKKSKKIINKNLRLVFIPFKKSVVFEDLKEDEITTYKFIKMCRNFRLDSLIKKHIVKQWGELFGE